MAKPETKTTSIAALKPQAAVAQSAEDANPYPKLAAKLNALDGDFLAMLGSRAEVQRFKRVVLNAVAIKPELLGAEPRSLLASCMRAAQDRLMLDNREAVLNLYSTKVKEGNVERWELRAQYLPMVAGIVKRLFASGAITYLDAAAVHARDAFMFTRGDEVKLTHSPYMGDDDPGPLVCAYVVMRLKSGELKREVMTAREIEQVRKSSKSPDKGPWKDWYDQQAIKSVIKRAYKQIDADTSVDRLLDHDNDAAGLAPDLTLAPRITADAPLPLIERTREGDEQRAADGEPTQAELYDMIAKLTADAKSADDLGSALDLLSKISDESARAELRAGIDMRAGEFAPQ